MAPVNVKPWEERNPTRICVCGGRDYSNYQQVKQSLDLILKNDPNIVIIQGGAKGADKLADKWAHENLVESITFNADWDRYGTAAGPIRNLDMIKSGIDILVAFSGGVGTNHMVNACLKSKNIMIWKPDTGEIYYGEKIEQ